MDKIVLSDEQIIDIYNQGPEAVLSLVKELITAVNSLSSLNTIVLEQQKIIEAQAICIENLTKENLELKNRILELESRMKKNSNNSSKPPSTDGYNKKKEIIIVEKKVKERLVDKKVIKEIHLYKLIRQII